jgi:hypothetical protein
MENNFWIKETWINATKGYSYGDSGVYETCYNTLGQLYKFLTKECGKCISKMYIDNPNNEHKPFHIGYVFQKREKYTDCNETYLKETWVSFHEKKDDHIVKTHYRYL